MQKGANNKMANFCSQNPSCPWVVAMAFYREGWGTKMVKFMIESQQ